MSSKSKRLGVNSGISLFLVLLIIMCLVSFASLSLTSALADMRLSEKYARQVEWYYSARNKAQEDLADLNAGKPLSNMETDAEGHIVRHYPAGENMQLTVIFALSEESKATASGSPVYRTISEKTEIITDYELDESLHVMTGESP